MSKDKQVIRRDEVHHIDREMSPDEHTISSALWYAQRGAISQAESASALAALDRMAKRLTELERLEAQRIPWVSREEAELRESQATTEVSR